MLCPQAEKPCIEIKLFRVGIWGVHDAGSCGSLGLAAGAAQI